MNVRFLVDFRGKLTREHFYRAGEEAEFEDAVAEALVSQGWAEHVAPPAPPEPPPAPKPTKKGK